jgi:MYXO-CTERM domain-containing protein
VAAGPVNFVVDTVVPGKPVITAPAEGGQVNTATPTITGTAEKSASVRVFTEIGYLGTVTADGATGAWSYTLAPGQALLEGHHLVFADARDAAGNVGPPSDDRPFWVDVTKPPVPVITYPASGARIGISTPTITGTAERFARIDLLLDSLPVGSTDADGNGQWSFTTAFLADGGHSVSARATDQAGNSSAFSDDRFFTIDTLGPAAPVISQPANGSFTNDSTPDVSGTGEIGATIHVFVGGGEVTTATVGADNHWTATLPNALSDGTYSLSATATDVAGNTGPSSSPVVFTVDTSPPSPPSITYPANGSQISQPRPTITGTAVELGVTVKVSIDGSYQGQALVGGSGLWAVPLSSDLASGPHTASAVAVDAAQNASTPPTTVSFTVSTLSPGQARIDSPKNGDFLNDPTPTLSGVADLGSTVEVYRDGNYVDQVATDGTGHWTYTFPDPGLTDGIYTFTVRALVGQNAGPYSDPVQITIDLTRPTAPTITAPANNSRTGNPTPTISGSATPGDWVDVRILNTAVAGVVVADTSGNWSYTLTPSQALGEGPHTVTAAARDAAGNVSDPTAADFTVDLTAPGAPVITAPANGSYVSERRPTITGTAEANSSVKVTLDGRLLGTVPADGNGAWSYPLSEGQALSDGTFVARAHATDAAGNVGAASTPVSFTVDLQAPATPVIVAPAQGTSVSSRRPVIRGTAEPAVRVQVSLDGGAAVTVQADVGGAWSFEPPADLLEGGHRVIAVAVDGAGNASPPSAERTFTVDSVPPSRPTIVSPGADARLNDSTPTVTGRAEPEARVTVIVDGSTRGEVVTNADGDWTYTLTPGQALQDGNHVVTAGARDAAGNESPPATPVSFSLDTKAPVAPQVLVPTDGTLTANRSPPVSGSSEVGTVVQVFIDGQLAGTAPVDADGAWRLVPSQGLADGTHTVTARAVDDHQNASGSSAAVSVVVDTTPPAPPVITAPANHSRSNNQTPTVTGTTEPGAKVEVFIDGQLVAIVIADGNGFWRYTLTRSQALPDGTHRVAAQATDLAGNVGGLSSPNEFTIDTVIPATPVITSPTNGARVNTRTPPILGTAEPGVRVFVVVDDIQVGIALVAADATWAYPLTAAQALGEGQHRATARAIDAAGNPSGLASPVNFVVDTVAPLPPNVVVPEADSTVPTQTPGISGTAEPGAQVEIFVDGVSYGTTTAGSDGSWSYQPSQNQALPEGTHEITTQARDGAGNVSGTSPTVTVIIDVTPPAVPVVVLPADGSSISDPTPLVTGTSEPDAEVEVLLDGVSVGRTRADARGVWSLEAPNPLADGEHAVAARARDVAGNVGPLSAANRFLVDTVAPGSPVLTEPPPLTNDSTPPISGTAEPGSTVQVYVDGVLVGEVTVGSDGTWSMDPTSPVGDGDHTVTVIAVDPAGNQSAPVSTPVTVDTTPPAAPVIVEPAHQSVHIERPPARGTATPGVRVRVSLDGVELPDVRAGGDGAWGLELVDLIPGEHTLVAVARDDAGNVSQPSNRVVFHFGFGDENPPLFSASGGGCACSVSGPVPSLAWLWIVAAAVALMLRRRSD